MRRRDFMTLLGATAAASPFAARAQQGRMPAIGLLNGVSNDAYADRIAAVHQGLRDQGFAEGQNVAIEYRAADGRFERLPNLAADLVRRQAAVIVTIGGTVTAQAAKAATSTIPIVFASGGDAVVDGLFESLNRPEANLTGVSFTNSHLAPKRLELMRELLPGSTAIAYLASSTTVANYDSNVSIVEAAARTLGCQLVVFNAGMHQEIETAFAAIVQQTLGALAVSNSAFLNSRRKHIIELAARHAVPTIYPDGEYVRAGGLMSYGVEYSHLYHWASVYAGRILKGAKPSELPVMLPAKFETVLNLKTAKALDLTVPTSILLRADEVIE
jgi:putative ABC transport system substrate-binding protein